MSTVTGRNFWATHPREQGAVAAITAIVTSAVLLVSAALALDLGRAWSSRGQVQSQVDAAALAAASGLPVVLGATGSTSQLAAAKYAAYRLVCHRQIGQRPTGVVCGSSLTPTSSALDSYASAMLTNGATMRGNPTGRPGDPTKPAIWFPTSNEVEVLSEATTTRFFFAGAMGQESSSTTVKRARAKLSSPGQVLPVAVATDSALLSGALGCYGAQRTAAKRTGGLFGVGWGDYGIASVGFDSDLPVLAVGRRTSDDTGTFSYPAGYPRAGESIKGDTRLEKFHRAPAPPVLSDWTTEVTTTVGTGLNVTGFGRAFNESPYATNSQFVYVNADTQQVVWGSKTTYQNLLAGTDAYMIEHPVPAAVFTVPGKWWVTVFMKEDRVIAANERSWWLPAAQVKTLYVIDRDSADSRLDRDGCARYLDSPRRDTGGSVSTDTVGNSSSLVANIRSGLDHPLAKHSGITSAVNTSCNEYAGVDGTVKDDAASLLAGRAPNCVTVGATQARSIEASRAWLGSKGNSSDVGRLDCRFQLSRTRDNCRTGRTFTLWGRTYNNDRFEDFIRPANSSVEPYSFAEDAYTGDGLAFLSPETARLDSSIYYSPRLFWAPVVTTSASAGLGRWPVRPNGASRRILTFRPVFVTQSVAEVGEDGRLWCYNNEAGGFNLDRTLNHSFAEYRSGGDSATSVGGNYTGVYLNNITRGLSGEDDSFITCAAGKGQKTWREPSRLQGLRFQTIAPRNMPEVPTDYAGPVTDYIGTGPRVLRLVR